MTAGVMKSFTTVRSYRVVLVLLILLAISTESLAFLPFSARSLPNVPAQQQARHHPTSKLDFFNFLDPNKNSSPKSSPSESNPKKPTKQENNNNADEPDLVEKLFSVFFGQPEESPMGLKRFGRERFPEQYPATVNEWADPVAGDDKEVAKLRPLLKNTNIETRLLQCVYNANKNGWSAEKFHHCVDKKGPSLVVATTTSGQVVGGYNPKGWVSYGEARGSIAAFLFVYKPETSSWVKLRKVGGPSLAQLDYPESGPMFGSDALVIPLAKDNPRLARSKLGSYYERFADGINSLFQSASSAQLKDLKVYQGVYEPDEYIPFTDAEPFALY